MSNSTVIWPILALGSIAAGGAVAWFTKPKQAITPTIPRSQQLSPMQPPQNIPQVPSQQTSTQIQTQFQQQPTAQQAFSEEANPLDTFWKIIQAAEKMQKNVPQQVNTYFDSNKQRLVRLLAGQPFERTESVIEDILNSAKLIFDSLGQQGWAYNTELLINNIDKFLPLLDQSIYTDTEISVKGISFGKPTLFSS